MRRSQRERIADEARTRVKLLTFVTALAQAGKSQAEIDHLGEQYLARLTRTRRV